MTGVDSSARDRAIEVARSRRGWPLASAPEVIDALLAHPEVLRALAGAPAPDAGVVREEWAVWDPTHTSDPNDEAARTRQLRDQADTEDYVTGTVQRSRIARRAVTYGPWTAVADIPADQPATEEPS